VRQADDAREHLVVDLHADLSSVDTTLHDSHLAVVQAAAFGVLGVDIEYASFTTGNE
jgi:hypothetical protein